jgi:hypothetical protein
VWPVAGIGSIAVACLVVTLVLGRPEPIAGVLALLGAAYAVILVVDDPPLDVRAAIVGAALLAVGELAYLSAEARAAVADEDGGTARRIGWVAVASLVALLVCGLLVAVVDVTRTGGLAIEAVGVAAAGGAIGLLVTVVREARQVKDDRD